MTHIAAVQTPAASQAPKVDKAATNAAPAEGATSAQSAFQNMLKGAARAQQQPSEGVALGLEGQGALLPELPVMLSIESLVGQTARLDAQADVALQSGMVADALDGAAAAGSWLGAGQGTALSALSLGSGTGVQTVAAGVAVPATALPTAVALGAAQAQLQQALGDAAATLEGSAEGVADTPLEQGRMVLSGEWQLTTDTLPTPAMQRVMGQVEQWAAAAAGLQPKGRAQEGGTPGVPTGAEASTLTSASSSGTRLTEQAVREAVQTEQSGAAADGSEQPPVEDMRFWLQGRQQRAQVVLSHGEQQVRVQVAVQGQQAHVVFLSDEQATRSHLDAELAQLREQLQEQGVELVGVRVQAHSGEGAASGQGFGEADRALPWNVGGAARTAQVAVPVQAAEGAPRGRAASGLDLYV